jgi:glutamine cyclotransferase
MDAAQEYADSTAPYEFYWQSLRNTIGERVVKAVATDKNGSTKTDSVKIQINSTQVRTFGYTVIKKYPHDTKDFTEGFIYDRGDTIYEGTGMTNKSWVKRYDLTTGKVYNTVTLASQYFGEGIAIHDDSIVEITYTSKVGFVYDKNTFKQIGTFSYTNSEGWGMTHDNLKYIMSDGTSKLTFWEFGTLKVLGSISVKKGTSSQNSINELEFFYNKIFANIYPSDQIVMIDLASAKVIGSVTLPKSELQPGSSADALNGIMYDKATDRIFVTGKYFSNTYEVKFFPKN